MVQIDGRGSDQGSALVRLAALVKVEAHTRRTKTGQTEHVRSYVRKNLHPAKGFANALTKAGSYTGPARAVDTTEPLHDSGPIGSGSPANHQLPPGYTLTEDPSPLGWTFLRVKDSTGASVGGLDYSVPKDHVKVSDLWVDPDHQRKGLATALMDEAVRRNPGKQINHGDQTPEGQAWATRYDAARTAVQEVAVPTPAAPAVTPAAPESPAAPAPRINIADLDLEGLSIRAQKQTDRLLKNAHDAEPDITATLTKVVNEEGAKLDGLDFRLKTSESMTRKLLSKSLAKKISVEEYAAKVGDSIRYTVVDGPNSNIDTGRKTLDALEKQGHHVVSLENSWAEGGEYYGVNVQMQAPNGTFWELQLHTADSLDRKWTSHYWYGISRNESLPEDIRQAARENSAATWIGLEKPKDWDTLGKQMFDPTDKTPYVGGGGPQEMPDSVRIPDLADDPELKQIVAAPGRPAPLARGTKDDPIAVGNDLDAAVFYLSQGAHVRLDQPDEVSVLMDKLESFVDSVKAKGEKAPNINLCLITVKGSNLFCHDTKGIPRIQMPQLSGTPATGSPAATLLKPGKSTVNVTAEFRAALESMGVSVTRKEVPASHLKATQSELDGGKVARLVDGIRSGAVPEAGIFVTRDGYIIDGHHRWAANVVIDSDDNKLGDIEMPVDVVDLDIGAALDFANEFTSKIGIQPQNMAEDVRHPDLKKVLDAAQDAPVGTVRTWGDQKYRKGSDGEWSIVAASAVEDCPGCGPTPQERIDMTTPDPDLVVLAPIASPATKPDPDPVAEERIEMPAKKSPDPELVALAQSIRKIRGSQGKAVGDSAYPINSARDLRDAIQAHSHAEDEPSLKRDLMAKARVLGREDLIPDAWITEVAASAAQQEWDEIMAAVPSPLARLVSLYDAD